MATTFIVRTDKTKGDLPLHVRVQYSTPKINIRVKTDLTCPAEKWNLSRNGAAWANYAKSENGSFLVSKMEQIRTAIDSHIKDGGTDKCGWCGIDSEYELSGCGYQGEDKNWEDGTVETVHRWQSGYLGITHGDRNGHSHNNQSCQQIRQKIL